MSRQSQNGPAAFDITIAGETNLDLILYGLPEQMTVGRELLSEKFALTLGGFLAGETGDRIELGIRQGAL